MAYDANYDKLAALDVKDIPAKLKDLAGGNAHAGKVVDKLKDALAGLREGIKAGIAASNG